MKPTGPQKAKQVASPAKSDRVTEGSAVTSKSGSSEELPSGRSGATGRAVQPLPYAIKVRRQPGHLMGKMPPVGRAILDHDVVPADEAKARAGE